MDVICWIERNNYTLCFPTTFIRYISTIITSVVSGAASFTCIIRHDFLPLVRASSSSLVNEVNKTHYNAKSRGDSAT